MIKITGSLLFLLIMLTSIGPLSTDLYLPALPLIRTDLNTDVAHVQLTLSIFMVAFALSQIIYGPISDRYGRRPAILVGMVGFVLGCLVCFYANSIEGLIIGRFFQALGGCAGPVVSRAVIRDCTTQQDSRKMMAIVSSAMAVAPIIAPTIGGYLTVSYGWRSNFLLLCALGLIGLGLVYFLLQETNRYLDPLATKPLPMLRKFKELLVTPNFMVYALIGASSFGSLFAFISGSSYVLIEIIGLTPLEYGHSFAAVAFSFLTGAQIVSRLKWHSRMTIGFGLIFTAIGCLLLAGFSLFQVVEVYTVIPSMMVFMFGFGFIGPSAISGALTHYPHMAGTASGLFGIISQSLSALIGLAVGYFYNNTIWPMTLGIVLPTLFALSFWMWWSFIIVPKEEIAS